MKKWAKHLLAFAAVLLLSSLTLGMLAHAEDEAVLPEMAEVSERREILSSNNKTATIWVYFPEGTKLGDIKSSNSAIKCKAEPGYKCVFLKVTSGKAATGKVTYTATLDGKTKNYTTKIVILNYKNPFKKLKIGNKSFTSKYKKDTEPYIRKKAISGKLEIKAAKGFKIVSVSIYNTKNGKCIKEGIKNGSKISLKKDYGLLVIYAITGYKDWEDGFYPIVISK